MKQKYFVCPHCEKPVVKKEEMEKRQNVNFCPRCGEEIKECFQEAVKKGESVNLMEVPVCNICENPIETGNNYCTKCGAEIVGA